MLKKSIFVISVFFGTTAIFAQNNTEKLTEMDAWTSKTSTNIKLTDYKLNEDNLGGADCRVRKMSENDSVNAFFYQISNEEKNNKITVFITYSDLLKIITNLEKFKNEVNNDVVNRPLYLENKYVTSDGVEFGYSVNGKQATWFFRLQETGPGNILTFSKTKSIEKALGEAKAKIEELKNQ